MSWPDYNAYQEAMQRPDLFLTDEDLARGLVECHNDLPISWSGGFAYVFRIAGKDGRDWAVRCFRSASAERCERHEAVASYLKTMHQVPTVRSHYITRGVHINSETYPCVKMEWVHGVALDKCIDTHLGDQDVLSNLVAQWVELMSALRTAGIAHGDLHPGNILVRDGRFVLIDYDGMFVPSLRGRGSEESGLHNYQHPDRRTHPVFDEHMDQFSGWVIYGSLAALAIAPRLWKALNDGDDKKLLFEVRDFARPHESRALRAMEALAHPEITLLARRLREVFSCRIEDVPPLNGVWIPKIETPSGPADFARAQAYWNAGDYASAAKLFRRAAGKGCSQSYVWVGFALDEGKGERQNHSEAVKWYERGCRANDAWACRNLAQCWEFGRGVPRRDYEKAGELYSKAIALGGSDAEKKRNEMRQRLKAEEAERARLRLEEQRRAEAEKVRRQKEQELRAEQKRLERERAEALAAKRRTSVQPSMPVPPPCPSPTQCWVQVASCMRRPDGLVVSFNVGGDLSLVAGVGVRFLLDSGEAYFHGPVSWPEICRWEEGLWFLVRWTDFPWQRIPVEFKVDLLGRDKWSGQLDPIATSRPYGLVR